MSERDHYLLMEDMLLSARRIREYTFGVEFDRFSHEQMRVDAVVRNLEIIGEAANRIDPEFRHKHQEIEWTRIRGLRNRIVHAYFGIDLEIVWTVVTEYIPELIDWLETILEQKD